MHLVRQLGVPHAPLQRRLIDPDSPLVPETLWALLRRSQRPHGPHDPRYLGRLAGPQDQAPKVPLLHQPGDYQSVLHYGRSARPKHQMEEIRE